VGGCFFITDDKTFFEKGCTVPVESLGLKTTNQLTKYEKTK